MVNVSTGLNDEDQIIFVDSLKESRLFQTFSEKTLQQIAPIAVFEPHSLHKVVLRENVLHQKFILLIKGSISLYVNEKKILTLRRKGDMIGGEVVITKKPSSVTAIADTDVEFYSFDIEALNQLIKEIDNGDNQLKNSFNQSIAIILADQLVMTLEKAAKYEDAKKEAEEKNLYLHEVNQELVDWIDEFLENVDSEDSQEKLVPPEELKSIQLLNELQTLVDQKITETRVEIASEHTQRIKQLQALCDDLKKVQNKLEEQNLDLTVAKEKAEKADHSKSEFLSHISHELRTPMHSIIGFADLGIDHSNRIGDEKAIHYYSRIKNAGDKLIYLLNDLLDLDKLESGLMEYNMVENDLKHSLKRAITDVDALIEQKKLILDISYLDTPVSAVYDDDKIDQVFKNLLSNAIKYTPEGQTISVRFSHKKRIGSLASMIEITFQNQGPGIPEEDLSIIFEKFVQSRAKKPSTRGTGLGLAICKQFVEAHNGEIWAENVPEGGVAFTISLPQNGN